MTDPTTELRHLVNQLARPHEVPVHDEGRLLGHLQRRPLLTILAEASVPTIASGGRGGTFGPRMSFDPAASELHTAVRARIRRWADNAGVPKHWTFATTDAIDWRDAARLLTAWHARTLNTNPEQWIPTLAGWVTTITDLVVDPPHRSTLDAPCPRCNQRWAIDRDGTRIDALQVTIRDATAGDVETACRNCGAQWAGRAGAEHLQDELHDAEHIAHGIACAGHTRLAPLHDLAVWIPIREQAYA